MRRRIVALAAVLALAAACTRGGSEAQSPTATPPPEPWRGGTLRLAYVWDVQPLGDPRTGLDPQKESGPAASELFRCCLLRTLFSYNGLPASDGGAEARPDLAAGRPDVSADGLTWTIRIRPGIRYAPPLEDVEITAQDFVRALQRAASPGVGAAYPYYYSIIQGFDGYANGDADTISGLETPDEHTLVVRLTEPAGDLLDRLAMAATAPIPPNPNRSGAVLGAAQGHDRGYGRFLVASGPYMIEGVEALDPSRPPSQQEPVSGYVPPTWDRERYPLTPGSLTLVRNPSWDPATDDLRAAYADRIEIEMRGAWRGPSLRATRRELAGQVEAGALDLVPDLAYASRQIRAYQADPAMDGRVTTVPTGAVHHIVLNLAMPPFDDLHVRRAAAFAVDEAGLLRMLAARPTRLPQQGEAATHLAPDGVEHDLLAGYDPYPTSLERARQEMALSRYDSDGDGRCDALGCRDVLALAREEALGTAAPWEVAAWLQEIGVDLRVKVLPGYRFYPRVADERKRVPVAMGFGWIYAYPNASTVLPDLFASSSIPGPLGYNSSLLGATPSQLREWGYAVTDVPSADDRVERCLAMTGGDQTECWADLDRYLMEDVVPAIPYMANTSTYVVSERVGSYSQSVPTGGLAFDRIALAPGSG